MHEAEERMVLIEVKMEALAALQFELKHFGLSIPAHEISAAGLHTAKDRDQSRVDSILERDLFGFVLFAQIGRSQIAKRPTGRTRNAGRSCMNPPRNSRGERLKVFAQHVGQLQISLHRGGMIKTAQRALQPQAVKTMKNPSDIGLMFFYERDVERGSIEWMEFA